MRAVVQRVSYGSVTVEGKKIGEINHGLIVLLGVDNSDNQEDILWLANKIINLRIFGDKKNIMNNSLINLLMIMIGKRTRLSSFTKIIKHNPFSLRVISFHFLTL